MANGQQQNPFLAYSPEDRTSILEQLQSSVRSGKLTGVQRQGIGRTMKLLMEAQAEPAMKAVTKPAKGGGVGGVIEMGKGFGKEAYETGKGLAQTFSKPNLGTMALGPIYPFLIEPTIAKAKATYEAGRKREPYEAALGALATLNPLSPDVTKLYELSASGKKDEAMGRGLFDAALLRLGAGEVMAPEVRAAKLGRSAEILAAKTVGAKVLETEPGVRPGRGMVEAEIGPTRMKNLPDEITRAKEKQLRAAEKAVTDADKAKIKIDFDSVIAKTLDPHEKTLASGTAIGSQLLMDIRRFRKELGQTAELDPVTKQRKPIDLKNLNPSEALKIKRQVNKVAFGDMRGLSKDVQPIARQLNRAMGDALDSQVPKMPPGGFRQVGDLIGAEELATKHVAELELARTKLRSIWNSGMSGPALWIALQELQMPHAAAYGGTLLAINALAIISEAAPTRLLQSRILSIAEDILMGDRPTAVQKRRISKSSTKGPSGPQAAPPSAGPGPTPTSPGGGSAPRPSAAPAAPSAAATRVHPVPAQAASPLPQAAAKPPVATAAPSGGTAAPVAPAVSPETLTRIAEETRSRIKNVLPGPKSVRDNVANQALSRILRQAAKESVAESAPKGTPTPSGKALVTTEPAPTTPTGSKTVQVQKIPEGQSGITDPKMIAMNAEIDDLIERMEKPKIGDSPERLRQRLDEVRTLIKAEASPEVQAQMKERLQARLRKRKQRAAEAEKAPALPEQISERTGEVLAQGASPEAIATGLIDTYKAIMSQAGDAGKEWVLQLKKASEAGKFTPEMEYHQALEALDMVKELRKSK